MLVATRDPMPHPAGHDVPPPRHPGAPATHSAPKSARLVMVLQLAGSLLAIPVGLASAYSIYRANFSVETTCQTLRGNIISMIDKQVDASAKRMLVRRDVETFEKTCGGVDPDAEAAFKALLAADKASPAVPTAAAKAVPHAASSAKEAVRKVEPHQSVAAKPPAVAAPAAAPAATAAVEPVQKDAAVLSDTNWLAAVRGALVNPERAAAPEKAAPEKATVEKAAPEKIAPEKAAAGIPPSAWPGTPAAHPVNRSPAQPVEAPAAEMPAAPAPVEAAAPSLPPPTSITALPAQPADPDHPVPPATVPEANAKASDSWVGKIPFVGQVLAR